MNVFYSRMKSYILVTICSCIFMWATYLKMCRTGGASWKVEFFPVTKIYRYFCYPKQNRYFIPYFMILWSHIVNYISNITGLYKLGTVIYTPKILFCTSHKCTFLSKYRKIEVQIENCEVPITIPYKLYIVLIKPILEM